MKGAVPAVAIVLGCGGPPAVDPTSVPVSVWREARAASKALHEDLAPQAPYSMNLALELEQHQLGRRMRARGTIAVAPNRDAIRMILIGPGGTTALDMWMCGEAYRFEVPALGLLRRGDGRTPAEQRRGLPVDFLRWWFLHPFEGRLLAYQPNPRGARFVLLDKRGAVTVARPGDGGFAAHRRRRGAGAEILDVGRERCGQVRYRRPADGIDIGVRCEAINEQPPPVRAFLDPDDAVRCAGDAG